MLTPTDSFICSTANPGHEPADILQIAVVIRQVLFLLLLFLGIS